MPRVVQTVLFTDMVASTERPLEVGDAAWVASLRRHHDAIRDVLRRYGGVEIDTAGDGFFARFDAPGAAVRAACAAIGQVATLGLHIRAGVHTGEVELGASDVTGVAVRVGERVVAHAEADEVLVSSTVRDVLAGGEFRFIDRGSHEIEGFADRCRLYAVDAASVRERSGAAAAEAAGSSRGLTEAQILGGVPTGEVTFLFTDIEGSTQRWELEPAAMRDALIRHDDLLRSAIEASGGYVFKTVGDAFCAAFASPLRAVRAAVASQHALLTTVWEVESGLRVRMALHTGIAEVRNDDYFGPPVNRVARLLGIGHGGQILLSSATEELVRDHLPDPVTLRPLGEHTLRDLIQPERVFQLVHPDLPTDFPLLKSLDAGQHNLPVQPTPLIGRERDVEMARQMLLRPGVRLLTLTGPGGIGKTRLALQVAAELLDAFPDGVRFVALAPISDPEFVTSAVAQALGVREVAGQSLLDSVKQYLRDKDLLLVLDNFEQVLPAAPMIADVLTETSKIKVVVTSRAVLHVRGEHELPVPPLGLPPRAQPIPSASGLTQFPAVTLFVERAADVKPDFEITDANAPAIAEICHRLDGLPLAIELAAARSKILSPQAMLSRLERRLTLLRAGARDMPARHQTLRDAIAWSYDLLPVEEQRLLRRLAVFVGGCTITAAETVCDSDGGLMLDVLDGLASLADKSLLRQQEQPDGEPRFLMLETIREFALDQLVSHGEADAMQREAALFFAALVEEAGPDLHSGERDAWLPRLRADRDNLRAALRWSLDQGAPEVGLRIVAPLWFWYWFDGIAEGRRWAEELLAAPGADRPTRVRGWALFVAAALAFGQGDVHAVRQRCAESAAIAAAVDDTRLSALASAGLGSLMFEDPGRGREKIREALAFARASGDAWVLAFVSQLGGMLEGPLGNAEAARLHLEAAVAGFESVGDRWAVSLAQLYLGIAALQEGDDERARAELEQSLEEFRRTQDKKNASLVLTNLALIAERQGRPAEAAPLFVEGLNACFDIGDTPGAAACLEGLADVARLLAQPHRSARLLGAVHALTRTGDASDALHSGHARHAPDDAADPGDRAIFVGHAAEVAYQRAADALREEIGEQAYTRAWRLGQGMPRDEVLEEAAAITADVVA